MDEFNKIVVVMLIVSVLACGTVIYFAGNSKPNAENAPVGTFTIQDKTQIGNATVYLLQWNGIDNAQIEIIGNPSYGTTASNGSTLTLSISSPTTIYAQSEKILTLTP